LGDEGYLLNGDERLLAQNIVMIITLSFSVIRGGGFRLILDTRLELCFIELNNEKGSN